MSQHLTISPNAAADRVAVRELVKAYARCTDRRDAKSQMALFTPDTHFAVCMDTKTLTTPQEQHSREALAPLFAELNNYEVTTQFLAQSTSFAPTRDRATEEVYCPADQFAVNGGVRRFMPASLRFYDTFVQMAGVWLFPEPLLYVEWMEQHQLPYRRRTSIGLSAGRS
jgi:hypothetical protein